MPKRDKMKTSQRLGRCIQGYDIFGVPVSLTYKNDPCIKSVFGGTITIIVRLGILAYLLYQCSLVLKRVSTIQYSVYQRDLRVDDTEYILDQSNFDMAVQIQYQGLSGESLEFQASFNAYQYVYVKLNQNQAYFYTATDGNTLQKKIKTEIPLEKCTTGRLGITADTVDYLGIATSYLCPKSFELKLKGNQASQDYKYVQFQLNLCNQTFLDVTYPGKKCASKSEQLRIMQFMKVYLVLQNSYFDDKDFSDNPIKKIIRPYFLYANANTSQHIYLQVGNHEVVLHDDIFYGGPKYTNFLETRLNYVTQETEDAEYSSGFITLDISIDDTVKSVTRQVHTFLMAFSASGGFMTALLVVARVIVGRFENTIYFSALIRGIYKYQANPKTLQRKNTSNKDTKKSEQNELNDDNQENSFQRVLQQIISRGRLVYGVLEQMKIRMKKVCRMQLSRSERMKDTLYKRGLQKIEQELDIINIAKELRTLKFITSVLLTKHQRFMIPYFNKHLLDSETKKKKSKQEKLAQLEVNLEKIFRNAGRVDIDKRILKNINQQDKDKFEDEEQEIIAIDIKKQKNKQKQNNPRRKKNNGKTDSDSNLKSKVEDEDIQQINDLDTNFDTNRKSPKLKTVRTIL